MAPPSYAAVPVSEPASSFTALSGGAPSHGAVFTSASSSSSSLVSKLAALGLKTKAVLALGAVAIIAGAGAGIAAATAPAKAAGGPAFCAYADYRLPLGVWSPSNYAVYWAPRFSAPFTFSATTSFDVAFLQAADCLLVHAGPGLAFSAIPCGASAAGISSSVGL